MSAGLNIFTFVQAEMSVIVADVLWMTISAKMIYTVPPLKTV